MTTLGLDLGRSIGYAVERDGKLLASGTKVLGGTTLPEHLSDWLCWLRQIVERHRVDVIAYEQPLSPPRYARLSALLPIHEEAVLVLLAHRSGLTATCAPPPTIKKALTGSGRAKKPDMIAAAAKAWGLIPNSPHHADALGVLTWALGVEA